MSFKKSALTALIVVAAAPFTAHAAGPGAAAAFNACTKAFVETYLPNRVVRQQSTIEFTRSPLEFWNVRKYTIALRALGATSGEVVAEARCIADRKGVVLVLDTPPTQEYVAHANITATLH